MQIHKLSLVASLVLASIAAQAQVATTPETEFYGLLDVGVRDSSNQNAAGKSKSELADGALSGSRLGLRGKRTIGSVTALYTAEAGFAPDTATSSQGGRLLGRQLFAGLDSDFGTVLGGRQYTVAHDVLSRFEALGFANNAILGYQDANYTGLRYDNTLKYLKAWGPLSVEAAHSFGEVAGSNAGSADGVGAVYVVGDLTVGASYQETKNVTSAYFGAVAAAQASKQKVFGGGLTYQWNASRLYAGYTDSKLDVADYKNRVYYLGVNHQATSSLQIVASVQGDKEDHAGGTGNRITSTLLVDYFLDKATDVYAEVDYTKVKDGWIALANNTALGTGNMFGKDKRSGVMLGLRLKF